MSVSDTDVKAIYTGDASTTTFAIPFAFQANSEIQVYVRDETVATAITETLKTITTHYTLTGGPPVTNVVFVTAPTATQKVMIRRQVALTQALDLSPTGVLSPVALETAYDKVTLQVQQLDEKVQRALKFTKTTSTSEKDMGEPVAEGILIWNDAATAIEAKTVAELGGFGLTELPTDGTYGVTFSPSGIVEDMIFEDALDNIEEYLENRLASAENVATTGTPITTLSSSKSVVHFTGSTATEVQGIATGLVSKRLLIWNRSTASITFKHQNASATAANRIITPSAGDMIVAANWAVELAYDATTARWFVSNPGVAGSSSLIDSSTIISDATDLTIEIGFDAAGTTGTKTTIASSQTANRTMTMPDATDTFVGKATTDTLTNKTLVAPAIGAATGTSLSVSGQLTSTVATGTAPLVVSSTTQVANLNAATAGNASTVTTNANLTGPITSTGNATAVGAQTGTGSTFVMQASPTLTTPDIGTPSAAVMTNATGTASGLTAGKATNIAGGSGGVIPYQSAADTTALLANGTAGQVLQSNGTTLAPSWVAVASSPSSSYEISNLGLATSVGSSALTIALKQADGSTDPGASAAAVKVGMRSSTLTSGLYNQRSATAATSLVISSGSTLGQTSARPAAIYVYLIDNAGTLELAASGSLFHENQVVSTTAEGGAGAADSGIVMYSTTARSNVPCRLVGKITNTQTTAGTWASAGTTLQVGGLAALITFSGPTVQKFTSGTSTYYTPAGVKYIIVKTVGGGGGGGGSGSGAGAGANATASTFAIPASTVLVSGGLGLGAAKGAGSAGGSSSVAGAATALVLTTGGSGTGGGYNSTYTTGGHGGSSAYGGGGGGGAAAAGGLVGALNTGGGGGGGGLGNSSDNSGAGGGAGGYAEAIILNPLSAYTYVVGAGGTGGTAGTLGTAGGDGAAGQVSVLEFYS